MRRAWEQAREVPFPRPDIFPVAATFEGIDLVCPLRAVCAWTLPAALVSLEQLLKVSIYVIQGLYLACCCRSALYCESVPVGVHDGVRIDCMRAATREWDPYLNATARSTLHASRSSSSDIAWRKTRGIMVEMERAVDERKFGYKRFGAPKKSLIPLKRLNADEKQDLM